MEHIHINVLTCYESIKFINVGVLWAFIRCATSEKRRVLRCISGKNGQNNGQKTNLKRIRNQFLATTLMSRVVV